MDFSGKLAHACNLQAENPEKETILKEIIIQSEAKKLPTPTGVYYEYGRLYMTKSKYEVVRNSILYSEIY